MTRDDRPAPADQPKNPLHGITLERVLTELVADLGWAELGRRIRIGCFTSDPSVTSSLRFLRKTPWAREKVETLYCRRVERRERENRRRAPDSGGHR